MIKLIYRTLVSLIFLLIIIIVYLTTIGIKTDMFNAKIVSKIKQIDPNIELKLDDVSATLDIFNLSINAKTIGSDLIFKDRIIKIETIKTNISLKSFINDKFAISGISISTKSLKIKDLITFIRILNKDPKLFIAEKFIKNGFLVADLKLEFDELGKIKNNYVFNGLIRDGKISILKKYDLDKVDLNFKITRENSEFNNIKFFLNNQNIYIPKIIGLKKDKGYLISGELNTLDTKLTKDEINVLIENDFLNSNIKEVSLNSQNKFGFIISKNLKINNLNIKSEIKLDELKLNNLTDLKNIFPKIQKDLIFKNQKLKVEYKKNYLSILGSGDILFQNELDQINYEIYKNKNKINFYTKLDISKNPVHLEFLNYKKSKNSNLELIFKGKKSDNNKLVFNEISLKEKNNLISIKELKLSNKGKINSLDRINLNYVDEEGFKNNLKIIKKNNDYLITGDRFNITYIIDELLDPNDRKKLKLFSNDFKILFDVENVYLDKDNTISNLVGFLSLNKNEISELILESKFANQESIKFTIKDSGKEKVTTLYSYKAKPFVNRYKFIKGFEEGDLDFYSVKKEGITQSLLKIDNFKIQEIPVLAKLLTLASLQGIADLLTGEGIRFTDFEMKFSTQDELMTIDELYAIGPAISILMEGYIQSKKLISLKGTLVPATTVNRTISSIPLIGDFLVGKKVGEGVFGVSFKIKGPPGDLETSVNPIKTLTPRFITRTLEKIKRN